MGSKRLYPRPVPGLCPGPLQNFVRDLYSKMKESVSPRKITFILDSSGSMLGKEKSVVNAINGMFSEWKKRDTLVQFNIYTFSEQVRLFIKNSNLDITTEISEQDYRVAGMTSLYDAIVQVLKDNKDQERTFVIITDGEDTSSSHFTRQDAKNAIFLAKLEQNASFVFIGEGEKAFSESQNLGLDEVSSIHVTNLSQELESNHVLDVVNQSLFPESAIF